MPDVDARTPAAPRARTGRSRTAAGRSRASAGLRTRLRPAARIAAPVAVLAIAALLRFWALDRPGTLVFDELFYVRDGITQLVHGYPTRWPDDATDLSGGAAAAFTDEASYAVHPPLGKWLIALGIALFGADSPWGWRAAVALAGVATVAVVMRLGWRLSRSMLVACLAGLLLAIDGVHVVLTRVALLDGFLAFFVALGALFVWRSIEGSPVAEADGLRVRFPIMWNRPWLFAAGVAFGAAAAVKWSGLYPFAAFLILLTVRDLVIRVRARERRAVGRAAMQACAAAALALPVAALVYLVSWAGWILSPGGWGRDADDSWIAALAGYHADMLAWHGTLSAPHPFAANPWSWPLALRPTAMHEVRWSDGCPWTSCVSIISPIPNPAVTWGGVAALLLLAVLAVARSRGLRVGRPADPVIVVGAFVVVGYLSGWLPWVLTVSRSAVFQFYAVVLTPFSALALALVLGMLCRESLREHTGCPYGLGLDPDPDAVRGRRIAVAVFVAAALALAAYFFPLWSGIPVADWFWQSHRWLPGWD